MNKRWFIAAIALVLMRPGMAAAQVPSVQPQGKVLLILRDAKAPEGEMLQYVVANEAGAIKRGLEKAGYQVDIASPTGAPWGTQAAGLKVDRKLAGIAVSDYKAFVVPCMAIETSDAHPDLAAVIKAAGAAGKLVAGQNGGVTVLAKSGVLAGKKYALVDFRDAPVEFTKATYAGTGVVKDGNIITSGTCPWMAHAFPGMVDGTPKLVEMLVAELKAR